MRTLFFSIAAAALVFSLPVLAVDPPKESECAVYKVKAIVSKKNKEIVLLVFPKSRSETTITVSQSSLMKVLPMLNQFGIFTVKLSAPLKKFSNNKGEVLTAQVGIVKGHELSKGTEISCIE